MVDVNRWEFLVILVGAVLVRYWVLVYSFNNFFFQDAYFDVCIMPLQFSRGEPIWGGGSNYFVYLLARVIDFFFPMEGWVYAWASILLYSTLVCLAWLILKWRNTGPDHDLYQRAFLGMLVLSSIFYPLVLHSVYTSAIAWSAGFPVLFLSLLVTRKGRKDVVLMGLLSGALVFVYPGLSIALIAMFFSWILSSQLQPLRRLSLDLSCFSICWFFSFWGIRKIFLLIGYGQSQAQQLGGGFLLLDHYFESLLLIFRDLFVRSETWNTMFLGFPYFPYFFLPFLFYGIYKRNRLVVCFALALGISVTLAALAWPYPGVRRVLLVFPFLFFILCVLQQDLQPSTHIGQRCFNGLWILSLVLTASLSVFVGVQTKDLGYNHERWEESKQLVMAHLAGINHIFVRSTQEQFKGWDLVCQMDSHLRKTSIPTSVGVAPNKEFEALGLSDKQLLLIDKMDHYNLAHARIVEESSRFILAASPQK